MEIDVSFMEAFEAHYNKVYDIAEKLFEGIEKLEHEYKTTYRGKYDFSGFYIGYTGCGYITLKGYYRYYGESDEVDEVEHDISLQAFAERNDYLTDYEKKLKQKRALREAAEKEKNEKFRDKKYQEYLKLKEEFGE